MTILNKPIRTKALALAIGTTVALLSASHVQAGAYGMAISELHTFRITTSAGTISLAGANRNANDSAFFENGIATNPRSVNTGPATNADVLQSCSGSGCAGLAQNQYARTDALEFSRGDAHSYGNMLTAAGSTVRLVTEAQRNTAGSASASAGDSLTGSVNLALSSAGFITFSFMARRDLYASVSAAGDKANVTIMDIFNISCSTKSSADCLSHAKGDGVLFQFAPDGDGRNGSDINGDHGSGSLDPFSLNMTNGTNDPSAKLKFADGFAQFSLRSNFALAAGIYTLNFSKISRTDIVVQQVTEPATLLLLSAGLAGLAFARRRS